LSGQQPGVAMVKSCTSLAVHFSLWTRYVPEACRFLACRRDFKKILRNSLRLRMIFSIAGTSIFADSRKSKLNFVARLTAQGCRGMVLLTQWIERGKIAAARSGRVVGASNTFDPITTRTWRTRDMMFARKLFSLHGCSRQATIPAHSDSSSASRCTLGNRCGCDPTGILMVGRGWTMPSG
jgi:hypothetical protein